MERLIWCQTLEPAGSKSVTYFKDWKSVLRIIYEAVLCVNVRAEFWSKDVPTNVWTGFRISFLVGHGTWGVSFRYEKWSAKKRQLPKIVPPTLPPPPPQHSIVCIFQVNPSCFSWSYWEFSTVFEDRVINRAVKSILVTNNKINGLSCKVGCRYQLCRFMFSDSSCSYSSFLSIWGG